MAIAKEMADKSVITDPNSDSEDEGENEEEEVEEHSNGPGCTVGVECTC